MPTTTDSAKQALLDAMKTASPGDVVTWAELKPFLETLIGDISLNDLGTPVTGKVAKVVGGAWAQADESGGFAIGGSKGVGKIPKVQSDGITVNWDTDATADPGAAGTLDTVLATGDTTDGQINFDESLTTPTGEGDAVSKTWLTFAPLDKTAYTGSEVHSTFFFRQNATKQGNSVNEVMHFGWNMGDGGGPVNNAIPAIGESWESNYKPGANRWVEKHEFYVTPNTFTAAPATQIRLSSYTIDSITGGIDYYHTVGRHYYKRPYEADATAVYFSIQPGGVYGASISLSATETKSLSITYDYRAGVTISGNGMDTGFKIINFQGFEEVNYANAGFSFSSNGTTSNFKVKSVSNYAVIDAETADQVDIGVESRNFRTGYFKQLGWRTKAGNPSVSDVPNGTWQLWENTSTGEFKIWLNKTGTLKSSAALT